MAERRTRTVRPSARVAEFIERLQLEQSSSAPWYTLLSAAAESRGKADAATAAAIARLNTQSIARNLAGPDLYALLEHAVTLNGLHEFANFGSVSLISKQGLYVIFDPREPTKFSSSLPRIVRVGTHGVAMGSKSLLRTRLRAHFGQRDGSGNHRASIFRLHVGNAIIARDNLLPEYPSWGIGMSASPEVRKAEEPLEALVSKEIGGLLFTFIEIADAASPKSMRAVLEHSLINFISADGIPLERPSVGWLGHYSPVEAIRSSGLWNIQHVGGRFDTKSLHRLTSFIGNPRLAGL